jgi:GNAT superfamily N-acetyltransferase
MAGVLQLAALPDRGRASLRRFDAVAHALYRDDLHWVAPLFSEFEAVLGTGNPFFQHAEAQLWVATRDGLDVGRIAAILDRTHNAVHGERTAHFGFFESRDDRVVSDALFNAAMAWARVRGMERVVGPMNPSINDECGLLGDGFGSPPALMMTYNPHFYAALVEAAGFCKTKDLLAFHIDLARCPAARIERLSAGFRRRNKDLMVRPVTKRSLAADVPKIKRIYNEAWEKNWGAVPLTDGEIDLLVTRLKPMLVDGLVWLAETPTEVAGFMLALPDANEFIQPLRGQLLSPGLFRALPYLVGWKCPRLFRLVALGTQAEFRGRGIEAVMFAETLKSALAKGFHGCEASWVLEDNLPVHQLIEWFDGVRHKTYRVYERAVG